MGILFAVVALFTWGIGDFLIQKSARKFGSLLALFYVAGFFSVCLLPFVYKDLPGMFTQFSYGLAILIIAGLINLVANIFDFKALRIGKISIVEPVFAFEVVVTAVLASVLIKEMLTSVQFILVALIVSGIFLISVKSFKDLRKIKVEDGVWLAIFAMIGMGLVNFIMGEGSRATNPFLMNWYTGVFIFTSLGLYFLYTPQHEWAQIKEDFRAGWLLIILVGFFDALAWLAFSFSTLTTPIAISTAISESYIVLAALLGIIFNRERLRRHQVAGLLITVVSAIILAYLTA